MSWKHRDAKREARDLRRAFECSAYTDIDVERFTEGNWFAVRRASDGTVWSSGVSPAAGKFMLAKGSKLVVGSWWRDEQ